MQLNLNDLDIALAFTERSLASNITNSNYTDTKAIHSFETTELFSPSEVSFFVDPERNETVPFQTEQQKLDFE